MALPPLLTFFYIAVFVLAFLVPENFRAAAFDSGGVTTGPMTVPFIMALGVGIASIRNDHHAADDSFGLVALCSIGPILAVMVLGLIYKPTNADYQPVAIPEIADSVELAQLFAHGIPDYVKEIALSLLPIVLFFGLFQIFALRLSGKTLAKILIGLVYTVALGILLSIFSEPVMRLFTDDTAVIESGKQVMRYFCPFYFLLSILYGLVGTVRGTGKSIPPMVVLLFSFCVFRIFWIQLAVPQFGSSRGVYVLYPISWTIGAVSMVLYAWKGKWLTSASKLCRK